MNDFFRWGMSLSFSVTPCARLPRILTLESHFCVDLGPAGWYRRDDIPSIIYVSRNHTNSLSLLSLSIYDLSRIMCVYDILQFLLRTCTYVSILLRSCTYITAHQPDQ